MDSEKQIEEMAIDLEEEFVLCGTLSNCGTKKCSRCYAKYLYEQGYRKIPEGSVVLTKEEFNEFRQTIITQSQEYTKRCNEMNDKIINARKQAVKEVIEKINEKLCTFTLENNSPEYLEGYTDAIEEICGRLYEVAKEFGVKL